MTSLSLAGQKITALIDKLNDRLTSYRLMLYFLMALVGWAIVGSFLDKVPYSWHEIVISAGWLLLVCWVTNKLISKFLDIPANKESDLITALILALILSPPKASHEFALTAAVGIAAVASKYIITLYKSHVFNPAAFGAFVAGDLLHKYPSWWVGTKWVAPLIIVGGILIIRKMKRFSLVAVFLAVYVLYLIYGTSSGGNLHFLSQELIATPVLFFAVVMLIEPLTSPTAVKKYLPYGLVVGLAYSITKLRLSPEEALLVGGLFTFLVAPNRRYELKFIGMKREAEGIYSYDFSRPAKFKFQAGQYMEWTLAHNQTDSRGNRRYLTIASSPTEKQLIVTIKQPANPSAFKLRLSQLKPGDTILASHLAGSFTLPKDASKKIALMAGGVGITPFRSMIKNMLDEGQRRDAALVYSANSQQELSFMELFSRASSVGLKTHYEIGGKLEAAKISSLVPDHSERTFYVSGPYGFVNAVETALLKLGVSRAQLITDYFPGYGG